MKHLLISLLVGLSSCIRLNAQEVKTYFTSMPDSLCPLLTAVNRADCIDFIESRMKAEVTNVLGDKTELTHLTSTYLSLKSGEGIQWQMKLLPVTDSTQVICLASTVRVAMSESNDPQSGVCLPADSHLQFYSTNWQRLNADVYLPTRLGVQDFFLPVPDSIRHTSAYTESVAEASLPLIEARLQPDNNELHLCLTTLHMLREATAKVLRKYLRADIVLKWDGGTFKRVTP